MNIKIDGKNIKSIKVCDRQGIEITPFALCGEGHCHHHDVWIDSDETESLSEFYIELEIDNGEISIDRSDDILSKRWQEEGLITVDENLYPATK